MLVDDHVVVRRGIEHVVAGDPEFCIVAETGDGHAALRDYGAAAPDVVLLDMRMPGLDGFETAQALLTQHPGARIIALSSFTTQDLVDRMIALGVRGYLPKEVSESVLKDAIRRVHGGEILTLPVAYDDQMPTGSPSPAAPELGDQQRRVLALMVKGLTNPEIAAILHISHATARYHVSAILKKLDVSNRAEAVATAVKNRLVTAGDIS